jgi:hypothetical protein
LEGTKTIENGKWKIENELRANAAIFNSGSSSESVGELKQ